MSVCFGCVNVYTRYERVDGDEKGNLTNEYIMIDVLVYHGWILGLGNDD